MQVASLRATSHLQGCLLGTRHLTLVAHPVAAVGVAVQQIALVDLFHALSHILGVGSQLTVIREDAARSSGELSPMGTLPALGGSRPL